MLQSETSVANGEIKSLKKRGSTVISLLCWGAIKVQ